MSTDAVLDAAYAEIDKENELTAEQAQRLEEKLATHNRAVVEDRLNSRAQQIMTDPVLRAHVLETARLCGIDIRNNPMAAPETPETMAIWRRRMEEFDELLVSRRQ